MVPRGEIAMAQYYVNRVAQINGDHEVHTSTCVYLPSLQNRVDLGMHAGCASAVTQAKRHFRQSNGCRWCSPVCHTS